GGNLDRPGPDKYYVGIHAVFGKEPSFLSHPEMGVPRVHTGMGDHDSILDCSGLAVRATTDNHQISQYDCKKSNHENSPNPEHQAACPEALRAMRLCHTK